MPAMAELLLKRATAASGEVYDVLSGSRIVGRIWLSDASPASQWVWTVSYRYLALAPAATPVRCESA